MNRRRRTGDRSSAARRGRAQVLRNGGSCTESSSGPAVPGWVSDGLAAGAVAAVVSGAPSTVHALLAGRDPLEAALAAGSLLLGAERERRWLLAAAVPAHAAVSLAWALVLSRALPKQRAIPVGALAGLVIAGLDLGIIGRRLPHIRALPVFPQLADHVAYGATVGAVLAARRRPSRGLLGRLRAR